jgi:cytohesin
MLDGSSLSEEPLKVVLQQLAACVFQSGHGEDRNCKPNAMLAASLYGAIVRATGSTNSNAPFADLDGFELKPAVDVWRLLAAAIDEQHNAVLQLLLIVNPASLGHELCEKDGGPDCLVLGDLLCRAGQCGNSVATRALLAACPASLLVAAVQACLPLHVAAEHGHAAVVEALLEVTAVRLTSTAPDSSGLLPLHKAAAYGHAAVVNALLEADSKHGTLLANSSCGHVPLHLAAANGHVGGVEALLAADSGHAALLAKDSNGYVPLHLAAAYGHAAVVEALLAADSSHGTLLATDADGWLPLHLAAARGCAAAVEALLAADSDHRSLLATNADDWLPLHLAARNGHIAVVEALLAADSGHGTVLARDPDGLVPLHGSSRWPRRGGDCAAGCRQRTHHVAREGLRRRDAAAHGSVTRRDSGGSPAPGGRQRTWLCSGEGH